MRKPSRIASMFLVSLLTIAAAQTRAATSENSPTAQDLCGPVKGKSTARQSQSIVYDWEANGGALVRWPLNITRTQSVPFAICGANNLLYTYSVAGSCTQTSVDPWGAVSSLLGLGSKAPASPPPPPPTSGTKQASLTVACSTDAKMAQTDWASVQTAVSAFKKLPETGSGCAAAKPCRISLRRAQDNWHENVEDPLTTAITAIDAAAKACSSDTQATATMNSLQAKAKALKQLYDASHDLTRRISIIPDSSCTLTIAEMYNDIPTTPPVTVSFTAGQPRLTLSAGPFFSEIQDRSYTVVTAPPAAGSTTNRNVLQINGNSKLTTYLTGLLNFSVPFNHDWLNGERGGFAISTGPVLRIGGQSSASAFGWYAGPAYHLFHLLYVSGGIHVGQFAGMPAGFTSGGQTVPSSFPTPVAQNRTTARFAFAVTLRAKDFSSLGTTAPKANASAAQKPK